MSSPDAGKRKSRSKSHHLAERVLGALSETWTLIRDRHRRLPPAVITLAPIGSRRWNIAGYWAASRWRVGGRAAGEIFIAAEALAASKGPPVSERVLETLLHEAAHALAHARGIQDCTRQGRYHNGRYRKIAEDVGLSVTRDLTYGWCRTALTDETRSAYADQLRKLRTALRGYRVRERGRGRQTRLAAYCQCEPPRQIMIACGVLEQGDIVCGLCDGLFKEQLDS